jgi:hypothetical protein
MPIFQSIKLPLDANGAIVIERHQTSRNGVYRITIKASSKGVAHISLAEFKQCYEKLELNERDYGIEQFIETATSQMLFRKWVCGGRCEITFLL